MYNHRNASRTQRRVGAFIETQNPPGVKGWDQRESDTRGLCCRCLCYLEQGAQLENLSLLISEVGITSITRGLLWK